VRRLLPIAVVFLAIASAACDDNLGLGTPLLASDSSVIIATPNSPSGLPSAIDFTQLALRRPERLEHATQWDFALRVEGGALRLVPTPFDIPSRRSLIQRSTQAYESIERAPTARSTYGDSAVTLQEGAVYIVRSRQYQVATGFCWAYGKVKVVDLDAAQETAELSVKANVGCGDDRLEAD
jgi:hypothetical protein